MNTARTLDPSGEDPSRPGLEFPRNRRFRFKGEPFVLAPIGPRDPRRIAEAEGVSGLARDFDPGRWVLGRSVATGQAPDDILGFYAIAYSGDPLRFDDTLAFVAPRARGRHLSHLLIYTAYLDLLDLPHPFALCEIVDHPRLRLHARCGFAPPVCKLRNGKVEVSRFDLNTVLARLESEDEIRELG